jgi:3-(3-hydroxy-phenyl)propionate hydroxylase
MARILIIGAGPVGVVSALACAQRGWSVTLLEALPAVDSSPRAATTHPATLEMIARIGLIEDYIAQGLVARYVQFWDRKTLTRIAEFDHEILRDETRFPFVVQTEQHKLANLGIARLRELDGRVLFSTPVSAIRQDESGVTITAGESEFHADYVIAADGGRSTTRYALNIAFEGYTWPERFLVVTTANDFEKKLDCSYRNYIADPEEWSNVFKVAGDDGKGRWRVVFPTRNDETDVDALSEASAQSRLQRLLPLGTPYEILHTNLYKVHQRVAARFREGRIFLAGDAAHINNSIGGLGLNSGIHDAMELVDTLDCVIAGKAYPALLDRYDRRRRQMNIRFVQQATVINKKRLEERDPVQRKAQFEELRTAAADPEKHKQFLLRSSLLESVREARLIA